MLPQDRPPHYPRGGPDHAIAHSRDSDGVADDCAPSAPRPGLGPWYCDKVRRAPRGEAHPEGITVDSKGQVYVTTFDVARAGMPGEVGHLFVFRPNGRLLGLGPVEVKNSSPLLLDLA